MSFALTMPKLSPTMTEGLIAKWHKNPGDFVEAGDLILEISTDKATVEHIALDPGFIRKILVQEGEKAEVNAPLAIMTEKKDEPFDDKIQQKPQEVIKQAEAPVKNTAAPLDSKTVSSDRVLASPLAKKQAKEKGLSLEGIQGSGPRGRIMSRDLEQTQVLPKTTSNSNTENTKEVLSTLRQVIGKRLQESKATIPHFYATVEVNAKKLINMREEMKASGLSITVNDLIVKATALALMEYPMLRAQFEPSSNRVIYFSHADISVAVSINGGLITPIVERAEEKTLAQISKEIKELSEKAKANKLLPHEFMGGAFTISNLGMFGTLDFQAIINPPQVGILAVGAALDQPVIENGVCVPGKALRLTLSCDHRVVDGTDGARFLHTLKKLLESPVLIFGK